MIGLKYVKQYQNIKSVLVFIINYLADYYILTWKKKQKKKNTHTFSLVFPETSLWGKWKIFHSTIHDTERKCREKGHAEYCNDLTCYKNFKANMFGS